MFGLDPLNPSTALAEMLLLLALAAFVGWLLGRLILNGRIKMLRTNIADREAELNNIRESKTTVIPAHLTPEVTAIPITNFHDEPLVETNAAHTSSNSSESIPTLGHKDTSGASMPEMDMPSVVTAEALEVPSRNDEQTKASKIAEEPAPVTSNTEPAVITGRDSMDRHSGSSLRNETDRSGMSMPGTSEAAVLSRIAARAHEVNFDRIGRASAAEADDLKDIIGIGPFLERKLNAIGIYTYRQVANFTKEDSETVNRIIEFFPGRIERDNWVDQSQAFHERKYGARS